MRQERDTTSGLRKITAVVCIIILVLPGVVFAATLDNTTPGPKVTTGIEPDVISVATTPVPPVFMFLENATITVYPPPVLIFDTPVIKNLTCTLYGIVDPGSVNVTIISIRWDWGDSHTPEYQGFPNSHVYSSPGTYTLSITARQSDGQNVTETTNISVGQPVIPTTLPATLNTPAPGEPGGSVVVVSAPVLILLEPVIDRMNVTLNGNLNSVSPGVTIESVSVDWNDGNTTKSTDLPVTHQYFSPGIFTITITGNQSDGQSTIKRITLDLKEEIPALPQQGASSPPPNNDPPVYLIIFATAIIVVAIVAVVQITQRGRGSPPVPDIPKAYSLRAGLLSENLPSPNELETICSGTDVTPGVLDSVIEVALEIAREGREGQAIGTSFVVGDIKNVLNHSKQFVLNPFYGHHEAERQITDVGIRGNIKEFAQLDGAFLITGTGVVEAAGRCITVDMSKVNLPGGLGSRHSSVAGITQVTTSIGVVVSQSGGLISIFRDGKIVYTINS
jgi:DNA integrity scanning protein DisA with diadenylate cyclase activity/PKD repeat protein